VRISGFNWACFADMKSNGERLEQEGAAPLMILSVKLVGYENFFLKFPIQKTLLSSNIILIIKQSQNEKNLFFTIDLFITSIWC